MSAELKEGHKKMKNGRKGKKERLKEKEGGRKGWEEDRRMKKGRMERKTEGKIEGWEEGGRMEKRGKPRMQDKSYPCTSGSSIFILVPFLFPKYLLVPHRPPST